MLWNGFQSFVSFVRCFLSSPSSACKDILSWPADVNTNHEQWAKKYIGRVIVFLFLSLHRISPARGKRFLVIEKFNDAVWHVFVKRRFWRFPPKTRLISSSSYAVNFEEAAALDFCLGRLKQLSRNLKSINLKKKQKTKNNTMRHRNRRELVKCQRTKEPDIKLNAAKISRQSYSNNA